MLSTETPWWSVGVPEARTDPLLVAAVGYVYLLCRLFVTYVSDRTDGRARALSTVSCAKMLSAVHAFVIVLAGSDLDYASALSTPRIPPANYSFLGSMPSLWFVREIFYGRVRAGSTV